MNVLLLYFWFADDLETLQVTALTNPQMKGEMDDKWRDFSCTYQGYIHQRKSTLEIGRNLP